MNGLGLLQFGNIYLLALAPLPWLLARLMPAYRDRRSVVRVPFFGRLARLSGESTTPGVARAPRSQRVLHGLLWLLLVLAMARPQWLEEPLVKTLPMRDLLVAVDLSGSMDTVDFTASDGRRVDRLTAVKEVLANFFAERDGDRVALLVFGSAAYVQVPFTEDKEVLQTLLDETAVRMAGPRTMLGDAIGLAITLFDRSELDERLMIVLTDGNDTGSQIPPAQAAEIARDKDIVIHTIGVGDPEAAGEEALDEAGLSAVATVTGGNYYRATDRRQLETVYDELDKLAPRTVDTISYRPVAELFHWPLAAAFLLLFLYHVVAAINAASRLRPSRPEAEQAP
jgi:Ca-activated chloride channel family protein